MEEKTNKEIYDKMVQAFNMVLEETSTIRSQNSFANEHIQYIHENTFNTFHMVDKMKIEIDRLKNIIKDLKSDVDKLREEMK